MTAILAVQPTADRSSGRRTRTRWYHVVMGGYEPIAAPDGTVTQEFVIDGVNVEVVSGGYFGWGEQGAIAAHVAEHYPNHTVVDTWPIARPIAA